MGADGVIRQLGSHQLFRNRWMRVRTDDVEFPDGTRGTYTVVDKDDFVLVLPYSDGGFWLVQQYRYPVGSREWEFPQGGWPPGHGGTQAELAETELREETGLRVETLTHLGRLYAAYGYCSQSYDVYLATGLTEGPPQREDSEADMVHQWHSESDVRAMVRVGRFADAHSVAALALFEVTR